MGVGINLIKDKGEIVCLPRIAHSEIKEFNELLYNYKLNSKTLITLISVCMSDGHLVLPTEINTKDHWVVVNNIKYDLY